MTTIATSTLFKASVDGSNSAPNVAVTDRAKIEMIAKKLFNSSTLGRLQSL